MLQDVGIYIVLGGREVGGKGAGSSYLPKELCQSVCLVVVWLARPSHLIAGALRAGKGRSSGSND